MTKVENYKRRKGILTSTSNKTASAQRTGKILNFQPFTKDFN